MASGSLWTPDYYSILLVEKTADSAAIETAYRRLADQYQFSHANQSESAVSTMVQVDEANWVLSHDGKRAAYDAYLEANSEPGPDATKADLLKIFTYILFQMELGRTRGKIVDDLEARGIKHDMARDMVTHAFKKQREDKISQKEGGSQILFGLVLLVVGAVVTAVTYSLAGPGGVYIVTTGLFIVGGLNLVKGTYRWLTS